MFIIVPRNNHLGIKFQKRRFYFLFLKRSVLEPLGKLQVTSDGNLAFAHSMSILFLNVEINGWKPRTNYFGFRLTQFHIDNDIVSFSMFLDYENETDPSKM